MDTPPERQYIDTPPLHPSSARDKDMVPVLKTMSEDEDPDVRYFSGEALGSLQELKA